LEKKLNEKDTNIDISCSMVDIYMDKLRDLGISMDKKIPMKEKNYEKEDLEIITNLSGHP